MKQKIIIVLAGVFFVGLIASVFLFIRKTEKAKVQVASQENKLPSLSPQSIGLKIIPSTDKKYVHFIITKPQGIKHLEWEFSYEADVPKTPDAVGTQGERVTQQFIGSADLKPGDQEFKSVKRELGTCSTGGTCRFDTGIHSIQLVLKVTKTDNKVYEVHDSVSL